ncbi:MAG: TIGR01777 family oxidoreductase [Deltaproteobacteria bacterium]|nr:TIGR01777 family oxidoreductase [Deltaproteobacteria bacterium]
MKVFITGATGFVGRRLVRTLQDRGDEVVAWVRDPRRATEVLGEQVERVATDVGEAALARHLAGADAVVNLAGENLFGGRWTRARKAALESSRIDLTGTLARTLANLPGEERPAVFVSASAVGYYGDRGAERLTEASAPGDDFLAGLCQRWEAATTPAREAGLRTVILRIGVVLGEGGALGRLLPLFRLGAGGRLGNGQQAFPWIHVEDLVGILLAALDDPSLAGVYNATAPGSVTNAELTRALAKAVRRPALVPVPGFAMKAALGEAAVALLGGQDAVPQRLLEAGFPFHYPDLDSALAAVVEGGR